MVKVTATIYKRTKNWVALLYIVDGINPPRRKSVTTDIPITKSEKTARKSAEEIRRRYEEELNNNLKVTQMAQSSNNSILFCDYMLNWLKMIKPNIRPTTYGGYERIINKRIYPYFKNLNVTLTELKPIHIQAFYTYLFNELKLKGATVKKYHANILSALSYAEKMDLITSNPAKKVVTPKVEPYIPTFYNKDELQLLFNIIKDTNIKIPILIGAFYGFRREEILGLKWNAIDFENNSITINFTVTEASYDGKHQIVAEAKTKTSSSYRTLPLIPKIKELLLEEKEKQRENKKIFKDCYLNTDNYVCVNEDGTLIKPDYLTHKFHEIIINNKLKPIRLHDLRHSCASLLLKNAVHMKDIQVWLGHSNFNTTANLYAHVDKTASENSAKVIGNVLSIASA
ncbi:MAG: tyrosine-type recombinase/integrase [Clostridia bacterium]